MIIRSIPPPREGKEDEHYEKIIHIDKSDALKHLCNLDKIRKEIGEILNNYCKEVKNDN